MDRKALIGLLSGVTAVIVTMIGVALMNPRPAEGANGLGRPIAHDCPTGARTIEGGYGVTPVPEGCVRG